MLSLTIAIALSLPTQPPDRPRTRLSARREMVLGERAASTPPRKVIGLAIMPDDFVGPPAPIFAGDSATDVEVAETAEVAEVAKVSGATEPLSIDYNEIRDYTSLTADLGDVLSDDVAGHVMSMRLLSIWNGRSRGPADGSKNVYVLVLSAANHFRLRPDAECFILADSSRAMFRLDQRQTTATNNGKVVEMMQYEMVLADIETMGQSRVVKFSVGHVEFALTDQQIATFRRYAELMRMDSEDAAKALTASGAR